MKPPIFISYFTGIDYYKKSADLLKKDLYNIGAPFDIIEIKDKGAYWKNTLYKPTFILEKMKQFKSDIIWIDADTKICEYHTGFKNWEKDILMSSHTGNLDGIKASPLGFKYNERNLNFIEKWKIQCDIKSNLNDIDLDHDVLKYETLPAFLDKITIEIIGDDNLIPSDFTDGKIIRNGISRVSGKNLEMRQVIDKNSTRSYLFDSLSLKDFN